MSAEIKIGDKVRLTSEFLKSTGQAVGGEGHSRWIVTHHPDCELCKSGRYVTVNQSTVFGDGPRHINVANLEKC